MGNLFDRLNKGQSTEAAPPEAAAVSLLERLEPRPLLPPIDERDTPIERLQKFLRRWRRPTISLREICIFGPKRDRNRELALTLAQELVQIGWLIPIMERRQNMVRWKIVPKGQRPAHATQPPVASIVA